jgi:hypothetical protein
VNALAAGPMVSVSRTWIRLSWLVSALMALASAAGVFTSSVYAKETASWAAQGAGQDLVNLLIACPALAVSGWYVGRRSARAFMVWLGVLIYVVYSYLMYAFFVHFGPIFPVYVAVLGLSSYALGGAVMHLRLDEFRQVWPPDFRRRSVSAFLVFIGVAFGSMWIAEIVRALVNGTTPEAVVESGLPVNPVHVLDLALLLPLALVTGVAHWKRRAFGLVFATPILVFFILMDCAIISMTYSMRAHGVSASLAIVPVMVVGLVISAALSVEMLRHARASGRGAVE